MSGFRLNQRDWSLQKEYLYCLEKDWRVFSSFMGKGKVLCLGIPFQSGTIVINLSRTCDVPLKKALLSCPFMFVWEYLTYQQWQHSCLTLTLLSAQKSIRSSKICLNLPNHSCFMYLIIKTFSIISCVSVPWSHKRKTVPCRCAKIKVCVNQSITFQIVLNSFAAVNVA